MEARAVHAISEAVWTDSLACYDAYPEQRGKVEARVDIPKPSSIPYTIVCRDV
jgi:hypothetical protein